jgi:heavy metal sensor kinase
MFLSIRLRLFLTILAVLLLGMVLAAGLAWLSVEQLFLANLRENLLAQASLTASALQGSPIPTEAGEPYRQTANVLPGIHTRLLAEQGGVILSVPITADAPLLQVPAVENSSAVSPAELRQRPEIQSAMQGTPATAVRRVLAAENRRILYAAAPIYAGNGEVSGLVYLATPLPPTRLPIYVTLQLAGAALSAILLAGAVGAWLSRRIARPIIDLAQAADAVSAGDLNHHVPVKSGVHELQSLSQAFNRMVDSLRRSDQAKNAFLADVTHELRTPLTVIKGTIETLEDGALDDAEGRGALLSAMHHETDRLIRLVNDLLVLARAEAGALNLKMEPVDLAALARERCDRLSTLAAPRNMKLNVTALGQLFVHGDADRLAQILDNLLDNAIRHAPPGSPVTLTIQEKPGIVQCAVHNQGEGIPPQHLPFIFERFYRADAARGRQTGGSGLGLAIVRSLVTAHGGSIQAESFAGQGVTILFCLPQTPTAPELTRP